MSDEISILIGSLDSHDKKKRREAIKKLKNMENAASVPLLKSLGSESVNVRSAAAEILGTYERNFFSTFLNLIKNGNENTRDGAARTIAWIVRNNSQTYENVSAMAMDKDYRLRQGSAVVLGYITPSTKTVINTLLYLLRDENINVRAKSAESLDSLHWKTENQTEKAFYYLAKNEWESLGKTGIHALPALNLGIKTPDPGIKKRIAVILGGIDSKNANSLLKILLEDSDKEVRQSAVAAISEKRDTSLYPLLIQSMNDSDNDVRVEASWSLKKAGLKTENVLEAAKAMMLRGNYRDVEKLGEKAIPVLIEFLGDDIPETRRKSGELLYSIGKPGTDAIKAAKNGPDQKIKCGAIEALSYIKEKKKEEPENNTTDKKDSINKPEFNSTEYWEDILKKSEFDTETIHKFSQALSDKDYVVRIIAVENLKKYGKKSYEIFCLLAEDENTSLKASSIEALGDIYEKKAVPLLLKTIDDEDGGVRKASAYSLGKIHDITTIPALIRHFSDSEDYVREECSNSVAKIGNSSIPFLENMVSNSNELVRISSLSALGDISDPSGIPPVTRSLNDPEQSVREKAMEALLKYSNFMFNYLMKEVHRVEIQGTKMEKLGMLSVLSKIEDTKIVPYVREYALDNDYEVKRNARAILDIFTEREFKREKEIIRQSNRKTADLLRRKLNPDELDSLLDRILNSKDTDAMQILEKKFSQDEIIRLTGKTYSAKKNETSKLLGKKLTQDEIDELLHRSVYLKNKKTTVLLGKKLTQNEIDDLIQQANSKKEETAAKDIKKQLTQNEIDAIIKKELEIKKKAAIKVSSLLIGLKSDNLSTSRKFSDEIAETGEPAVEPLINAMNNADQSLQEKISGVLIKIGKPGIRGMIRTLNYGKPEIRTEVAKKIPDTHDSEAFSALHDRIYTENDPAVEMVYLKSFFKTKDKRVFDVLKFSLKDKDSRVRLTAVNLLAELNDDRSFELLISLFDDSNETIREKAVKGLVKYGNAVQKPLITALKSEKNSRYKENAAKALEITKTVPKNADDLVYYMIARNMWSDILKLGQTSIQPLYSELKNPYSEKRKNALSIIIKTGTEESVRPLSDALSDMDEEISCLAKKALTEMGQTALPALKTIAEEKSDYNNRAVIEEIIHKIEQNEKIKFYIQNREWDKLEVIGPGAISLISRLLYDKNDETRLNAVRTIGRINTRESLDPLIKALDDKKIKISGTAQVYLVKYGTDAVFSLNEKIKNSPDEKNTAAKNTISLIEQNERIKHYIQSENWVALREEGLMGLNAAKSLLKSKDPKKRLNAVFVISGINRPESIYELINALFDEDDKVSDSAEESLLDLGEKAVPMLILAEKNADNQKKKEILHLVIYKTKGKNRPDNKDTENLQSL
ncbi:HEAT repeat protein [Methanomicrobium sp. W14]|uniref:HEAT repeat domain-containing protein n=1 Tax=Methanomicrobium sp. W14 TaxID=2817839 RepID=UPI001AE90463|nr:HEAT repeat domain-containing protein [Methanomicrobium sp. W14]MBP2132512.1 HEAT repeat protein [Methanomicrobium sp. W14]